MLRAVVRSWFKIVLMGATALFGASLLLAGPALAADVTTTTTTQPTTSATTAPYGPITSPSTIAPTTAAPVAKPATIAFTGADIAAMATVGAIAIGVGGTLILVSRRRRSHAAEGQ